MLSARTAYVQGKALLGRVFRLPRENPWGRGPHPGVWQFARAFVACILPFSPITPLTFAEWLSSMPSRRRRVLLRAAQTLINEGWNPRYALFSAFVKEEMLPWFSKDGHDLVPMKEMLDRLIQGPHDVTHVIAGPKLKAMVRALKGIWGPTNSIFYGSTTPDKLQWWLREVLVPGGGTYFWMDFSMYDNTHSHESWSFMEDLYRKFLPVLDDDLFWKVMDCWREPSGRIGPFLYKARCMNASGRDDTALANGVLNGIATYLSVVAAWWCKDLLDLTVSDVERARPIIKLSVCGDDSLGKCPEMSQARMRQFADDVSRNVAMFGFEAKLNVSTKLSDAVYLGNRPYPTRAGWFWGKTIGRATYKMGWVIEKGQDIMAHITGLAEMHKKCSSHVPVLSDLAEKILELRMGMKVTRVGLLNDPDKPWTWTQPSGVAYDDVTLQAVADTYTTRATRLCGSELHDAGLSVPEIRDLIGHIKAIKQLPFVVDHPVWRRMIMLDDL